jgi:two-component system, chemotaxis family, chemotaxis protein CheY
VAEKIMVVDDSALSRRTMRRILESSGYSVVEAADGMAALEMYFIEKPDAVLLDLVMKGMYGLDVLARLREMDPNVRVIIVSADIQRSTRSLAEEGGALALVNKPLIASEVIDALRATLIREGPLNGSH